MTLPKKREPLRIRLTLDSGIASYLRALCESEAGIFGDERATIIYAVRGFIQDLMKKDSGFRAPIIRHLPPDLRHHWEKLSS